MSESFSTGLFDCLKGEDSCHSCCRSCCSCACTSCVYGENVLQLEGHEDGRGWAGPCFVYFGLSWLPCGWQALVAGPVRGKIRQMYGLKEEPCSDFCVHFWCSSCAVCQEARELRAKGTPLTGYGKGIEVTPARAIPVSKAVVAAPPTQEMAAPSSRTGPLKPAIHTIAVSATPTTAPGGKSVRFSLESAEVKDS